VVFITTLSHSNMETDTKYSRNFKIFFHQ